MSSARLVDPEGPLYILQVFLDTSQTIEVEVKDAKWAQDSRGKSLNWTVPNDWRNKILHVDLDHVVAVVVTDLNVKPKAGR